jgi:hypothetical protein
MTKEGCLYVHEGEPEGTFSGMTDRARRERVRQVWGGPHMKIFCDTSVLVAGSVRRHPHLTGHKPVLAAAGSKKND